MNESGLTKHEEPKWTAKREEAALLSAIDELTRAQIAERVCISLTTLDRWRQKPDFQARVDHHVFAIRARIRSSGIAIIENRIKALQKRWEKMQEIIEARAVDPKMQEVPGGKTGLITQTVKSIGSGDSYERILLYEVDTALLKELREHEKQAAQELGQWAEKHELTGAHGGPIETQVSFQFDHEHYASLFDDRGNGRSGAAATGNGSAAPAGDGLEQSVHPEAN